MNRCDIFTDSIGGLFIYYPFHILNILVKSDCRIGKIARPALNPFIREKTVVSELIKLANTFGDGQGTASRQYILYIAIVTDYRILDVHVFCMATDVFCCFVRTLAIESNRMMQIP